VGRAFGLFLLVVGIGLAAYGLPTSETSWPQAGSVAGQAANAPASVVSGSTMIDPRPAAGETVVPRTSTPRSAQSSQAKTSTAGVANQPVEQTKAPQYQAPQYQAPMDKLRAAGQVARAIASGQEPEGSHQPLSQTGRLDPPPVPKPVELPQAARIAPPAPSVVAAARRETAPVAELPKPASGWKTVVTQTPPASQAGLPSQTTAAARETGAETPAARAPAPTRAATLSISPGAPGGIAGVPVITGSVTPPPTARVLADSTSDAVADPKPARLAVERPTERPQPEGRTRVAQRYTPPVYLGKTQNSGSSSSGGFGGGDSPRRFKAQDMWENNKRNGQ
jgi:hypothetical protein